VEYKRNKLKSVKRTGPKTFQMKMKDDVWCQWLRSIQRCA
jgi:hypothetical protein